MLADFGVVALDQTPGGLGLEHRMQGWLGLGLGLGALGGLGLEHSLQGWLGLGLGFGALRGLGLEHSMVGWCCWLILVGWPQNRFLGAWIWSIACRVGWV